MIGKLALVLLAVAVGGLAGCSKSDSQSAKKGAADVQKSAEQAMDNLAEAFNKQKDALVRKSQQEFDDLQVKIDDLNTRAKDSSEYQDAKENLEKAKAAASKNLQTLKEVGQDKWADAVKAYDAALAGLKKAYDDAQAKVKS